jgi:hypothetical protein
VVVLWACLCGFAPLIARLCLGIARWHRIGPRPSWRIVVPLIGYVVPLGAGLWLFEAWRNEVQTQEQALIGVGLGFVALVVHIRLLWSWTRRESWRYL